jgi:hypothetical protein
MDLQLFLPSFLGVLAAFGLEHLWSYAGDRRARADLLRGIKDELEQGKERLDELQGKLVPRDSWESAINSGQAMLLKHEVRSQIRRLYFAIDNYNYEIKLVRQLKEQARQAIGAPDEDAKARLGSVRWRQSVETQKSLSAAIETLLKQDFWAQDC